ncbi:ATP-binding protein [Spirillospora sp. CA-294931]|uniref:ATP-binding protein n=1 Tax=Spirillospora sp. CA-294931 TaxID=3240042 RepID=UPI003D94B080
MRFGVLGAVEAWTGDGETVPLGGPRVRALLAMLLLDAGRAVSVARLVDGLYGTEGSADPEHALQSQVSRLRRSLPGGLVEFASGGYRLAADPGDVDVHRFERLAGDGRRAFANGDAAGADRLLREALDLWRGPALADVRRAPFAEAQAGRLDELRLTATEDRFEARLARGEYRELLAELPEAVAVHPLRERLRGQLMRALYGDGRQAEALEVYQDARRALAEELGVDPSPALQDVHLAVLNAERALTDVAPCGVPAQLTSFVGRDDDLRHVAALLRRERLVTLTGTGGVGKTRLAIEAAERESGDVCFADLSEASDAAQAVIGALGLREAGLVPGVSGRAGPVDRLVAGIGERRLLLVLDNCERLARDVARLVRPLLASCRGLRVLVTSRERLDVTGEALYPVAPLADEAVRLFADRAAAVQPGFEPGAPETVARICRALDGLPLAIELAAARSRTLAVEEIASRLDDRFRLLSRGDRSAPPRHRTLRAVVGWSWDLLGPAERALAARLTVLRGGGTLDAVLALCGDDAVGPLADLADKSLVELGGGRYRMLETIRAFCAEQLDPGERERTRAAHTAYFLGLAEAAEPRLRGPDQLEWLARLDAERGNLDAALRAAEPEPGLRLLAALSWYGQLRGLTEEYAPIATALMDAVGGEPPDGLDEEYTLCVATAAAASHDHDDELRRRLTALGRPVRHPSLLALRLMVLGPGFADQNASDPWSRAYARLDHGVVGFLDGDASGAGHAFEAALDEFRRIGDLWGVATALDQLAAVDASRATALIDEAIAAATRLGAVEDITRLLVRKGDEHLAEGRLDDANDAYERAADFARRSGMPETLAGARRGLGEIAYQRGDLAEARELYELALPGCDRWSIGAEATRRRILAGLDRLADREPMVSER